MTTEEIEASQGGEDGVGGPGAPTPLSALEVCLDSVATSKLGSK